MKKLLFAFAFIGVGLGAVGCDQLPKLGLGADGKLATASEADCGYVQNNYGQRVSWKQSLPIKIFVDPAFPEQYMPVLNSAGSRWEAQLHRTLFVFERAPTTGAPDWDGRNVLYWQKAWDNSNRNLEGLTTLSWYKNQLVEADIKINAENYTYFVDSSSNYSQIHLESLLVHELGHLLGLKHLEASSVMLVSLDFGTKRDVPTATDIAHMHCEYN